MKRYERFVEPKIERDLHLIFSLRVLEKLERGNGCLLNLDSRGTESPVEMVSGSLSATE